MEIQYPDRATAKRCALRGNQNRRAAMFEPVPFEWPKTPRRHFDKHRDAFDNFKRVATLRFALLSPG
jgi:hypothetical protein